MPYHLGGGKITSSHSTIIDAALPVIRAAEEMTEVSKIAIGFIKAGIPNGQSRIKFNPITGGLRVQVRGNNCTQELFIYTEKPGKTQRVLEKAFRYISARGNHNTLAPIATS